MDTAFERLETARLVLRRFSQDDAGTLAEYRSVEAVARYQAWEAPFPKAHALAIVTELAGAHPDTPGEWFQLAIAPHDRPWDLLGDVGFRPRADEPAIVDVGFTLAPAHHGRGYATEAVEALLTYLFEERAKHKVCADCDTRNVPSWRLLERLGFRREGELRASYCHAGAWADEFLYGILVADWRARREAAGR